MMEIFIKASKHKISNKSYQISINKIEKSIDQAFDLVAKSSQQNQLQDSHGENIQFNPNEIGFFNLGEVLTHLNIFRETFEVNTDLLLQSQSQSQLNNTKSKLYNNNLNKNVNNNIKPVKKIQNYKDIQLELKKTKKSENRKRAEIQFLEQIWMILNPENNASIRIDTIKEFLKILFSPVSASVKEVAEILTKFLQAIFFLNTKNFNEEKALISPISQKQVDQSELWSIETLVKEFLTLKENILAYKPIKNLKPQNTIYTANHNKELTFKPRITTVLKNSEYAQLDFESRLKKFQDNKKENLNKKTKEIEESVSKLKILSLNFDSFLLEN
jgi:hypothetical protein